MQNVASVTVVCLSLSIIALGGEVQAQVGDAAPSAKTATRVITLGTRSGPTPTVGRAQSSNLLTVNGAQYIIDAGDGVTRRLIRRKTNFRNIDTIFITHPHSDHTGGLGGLMTLINDSRRTKLVNIYGPPGTAAAVQGLVQFLTVSSEIRISDGTHSVPAAKVFHGHDTATGVIFQDANVKVTAVENSHFNFPRESPGYGKYKSFAYRFDTADRSVVFSGDTGPSDAVAELAKGADLLVSEVTDSVEDFIAFQTSIGRWQQMTPEEQKQGIRHHIEEHITPDELGKLAAKAGVKTLVLTHLPASAEATNYVSLVQEAKKHFSGQVMVAKDLMEF